MSFSTELLIDLSYGDQNPKIFKNILVLRLLCPDADKILYIFQNLKFNIFILLMGKQNEK